MTTSIEKWDREDTNLIHEMDSFEENWQHKKPCKRYAETGYCSHLEQAQKRRFGKRVSTHLSNLSTFLA